MQLNLCCLVLLVVSPLLSPGVILGNKTNPMQNISFINVTVEYVEAAFVYCLCFADIECRLNSMIITSAISTFERDLHCYFLCVYQH